MTQGLFTVEEVSSMIRSENKLLLAGDVKLLSQLPKGNWIGGSTPYFILNQGCRVTSSDKIFVNQLPDFVTETVVKEYDETNIQTIFNDGPENGFTVLIMPYNSLVSVEYALNATNYENFAAHPVCGWCSGQPMEVLHTEKACTASGIASDIYTDKAVAMHVSLPENKYAEIHIYSPYKQGNGDVITFDYEGMTLKDAFINGVKRNFAEYLREINHNMFRPIVADYCGAQINVVSCDISQDELQMTAPVFKSLEYRIAAINDNIVEPSMADERIVFSVTCVGFFIQPDLCEQYLKKMNGPVVFSEIAYQLVGQTTVYVTIDDATLNTETL